MIKVLLFNLNEDKDGRSIGQPKGHNQKIIVTKSSTKSYLSYILHVDAYLMVPLP